MDQKDMKNLSQKSLNIELSNDIEKGVYSNQIIMGFSQKEFIIDFGLIVPPGNKIKIVSRIITNPMDAKVLLMVLNENINRYEKMFQTINVPVMKDFDKDKHSIN